MLPSTHELNTWMRTGIASVVICYLLLQIRRTIDRESKRNARRIAQGYVEDHEHFEHGDEEADD